MTMTKRDIIERIQQINSSAQGAFLATFEEDDLLAYLHQLQELERERQSRSELEMAAV